MLFLHETHKVVGSNEDEFEAAYRDQWMPTMAESDYARLLWYTNHAHGSGLSYNVVTITAITDGRAWEELATRIQSGDLQSWAGTVDDLRHDVFGKILMPVDWSPLQEVDLGTVPTDGRTHELSLFMEDTGWPYVAIDDYIQGWYDIYYAAHAEATPRTAGAGHPGVLPGRPRHPSATRGHALAEDSSARGADPTSHQRDAARAPRSWLLYARRLGAPRPVGIPAAAD